MATLIGQSCGALVALSLLVDYICVQRCLSTVVAVASLCGPMVTHLKIGKTARSPSFEELPRTSRHRARCGPLYHRVLVFCITSAFF
jgi:alpha-beta hydrolase superfamily lysophospholipase